MKLTVWILPLCALMFGTPTHASTIKNYIKDLFYERDNQQLNTFKLKNGMTVSHRFDHIEIDLRHDHDFDTDAPLCSRSAPQQKSIIIKNGTYHHPILYEGDLSLTVVVESWPLIHLGIYTIDQIVFEPGHGFCGLIAEGEGVIDARISAEQVKNELVKLGFLQDAAIAN